MESNTTPLGTIAGENGSRNLKAGESVTGARFQTIQITTAGTITLCEGLEKGVEIDFRTDERFLWDDVPVGLFITGKNRIITSITMGTAAGIAT